MATNGMGNDNKGGDPGGTPVVNSRSTAPPTLSRGQTARPAAQGSAKLTPSKAKRGSQQAATFPVTSGMATSAVATSVDDEQVHVRAVKTLNNAWFGLSRKAGTDKATLMDHYRRLFKFTLMVVEKYDSKLDAKLRSDILDKMRFCHTALAPRVPSLVQIYSTIESVFAIADIDRQTFRQKISDLMRAAECLTSDPVDSYLILRGPATNAPRPATPSASVQPSTMDPTEQPMDVDLKSSQNELATEEMPMDSDIQGPSAQAIESSVVLKNEPITSPPTTNLPVKFNELSAKAIEANFSPQPMMIAGRSSSTDRPWGVQAWLEQQEQVVPERAPPDDAMPTEEVLEKLNEVYRTAVDADDTLTNFCKTLANLTCHRGVQLGWQCFRRSGGPPECTEALVSTFFLKDLINEDSEHCCTRDLMLLWVRMQKHQQMGPAEIGRLASSILDRHSDKSGLFYMMFDVLLEECGFVGYPVMIELMLRGMGVDLNDIEECGHRGESQNSVRADIERNLARQMLKWCVVFEDFPLVMRECAFSSFSLYPTRDALDLIKAVSVRICENRDPSCRCYGHRIEDMAEPRQPGRPEYELLPQDDMFFFEPVLDSELPGVHYDTLKDMVTVLHAVRTPALALTDDLDKYLDEFYSKGRGAKLPTEMRLLAQAYGGASCKSTGRTLNSGVTAAPPEGSADSESDSDSSAGSSEFRRRLEQQRKEISVELSRPGGKKAAGACHKLKTKDKTRPAARRSARQLEREKAGQQGEPGKPSKEEPQQKDETDSLLQDASLEAIESNVEMNSSVLSAGIISSAASSTASQMMATPPITTSQVPTAGTIQMAVVIPQQTSSTAPKVVMVSPQQLQRVQMAVPTSNSPNRPQKIQVVLNGPKVEVAATAAAAAAAAQQQVVVPQTTDMTPVAIDTALTALQLPSQLQTSPGKHQQQQQQSLQLQQQQVGIKTKQTVQLVQQTATLVSSSCSQQSPDGHIVFAPNVSTGRTISTPIKKVDPLATSSPNTLQTIQPVATTATVVNAVVSNPSPRLIKAPQSAVRPVTETSPSNASTGNLKTPNFRAVLDRFDKLCGISLTPPSLTETPVRLEVLGGNGATGMPKLANVQIRNPKKLPAATPLSPTLSPSASGRSGSAKSNALDQLPPDPTRGKISADLLRRLKEEVDNRCSNAPITQFFKYQQKKPVFTNRKEVAVKFSIRKQGPATPADKDKNADRVVTVPPASPCNSSNQTRTAAATSPQTPMSFAVTPAATTFIASPPPPPLAVKTIAKGRLTPARVSIASSPGQTVNRCSPVAVRIASPSTATSTSGPVTSASPAVVSVSGVSAGVSVITTGGTIGNNEAGGVLGVLGTSGAAVAGGAVQVVGCQQLQVEKGSSGWTAATFTGVVGVRPEAKVEGGRNTLSLQAGHQQVQVVTAVRGQHPQQQQQHNVAMAPPGSSNVSFVHTIRPQQQQPTIQQQQTSTTPRATLRQPIQQTSPVLVTTVNPNNSGPSVQSVAPSVGQSPQQQQQQQHIVVSSHSPVTTGQITVNSSGPVGVTTVGAGMGVRLASPQVIRQVGGQMGPVAVATIKDAQGGQQNVLMKVISSPQTTTVQGQLTNKTQPSARIGSPAVVKAVRATPSPVSTNPLSSSPHSTQTIHIVNNAIQQQQQQQQHNAATVVQNSTPQIQTSQNSVVSVATNLPPGGGQQQIVMSGGVVPQLVRAATPESIKLQVQNAVQQALASQRLTSPSPQENPNQPLHVRVRINGPTAGSSGQVAGGQVVQLAPGQLLATTTNQQVSTLQMPSNASLQAVAGTPRPTVSSTATSSAVTTTSTVSSVQQHQQPPTQQGQPLQQQQQSSTQPQPQQQRIITTGTGNKIMIPVNSLLQQGAIATSVNGVPVLIIKNHQTGQQQIVHMRQVQHVQAVPSQQQQQQQQQQQGNAAAVGGTAGQQGSSVGHHVQVVTASQASTGAGSPQMNRSQLASAGGTQLAVLRQGPTGLKQQTVVVTQAGQQATSMNRAPIQVTLPVGPSGGQQIIVPSSQASSGVSAASGTPVTVVTTSGTQNQQFNEPSTGSQNVGGIQATTQGGGTTQVVVSGPNTVVSQGGGLFSTGGQPITVSIAGTTNASAIITNTNSQQMQPPATPQQIHQVVQVVGPGTGSAGGTIPSSAIVVNQSGQRLVTVSPDFLQAAVKSGQTKIITYKPALQQPLLGGRAKVVAAEVVGSPQHKQQTQQQQIQQTQQQQQKHQQKKDGQLDIQHAQSAAGKGPNKLLQKILPHPSLVQQQAIQKTPTGVAVVQQSPGLNIVQQQQHQQKQQQSSAGLSTVTTTTVTSQSGQQQHILVTAQQPTSRLAAGTVQMVKKIVSSVGGVVLNNNNNNSNNNISKGTAAITIVNKSSTVAQVLKAPIIARQISEKERLREITPVLDEDALMEQIMAAEVKEHMAAVKRTILQCVKADKDELENELLLNGNASDETDVNSNESGNRSDEGSAADDENGEDEQSPSKKRRLNDDAEALRSISEALSFAILSESCSAVAEEELNAEKTIENEMSVSLPVLSSDSEEPDAEDDEALADNAAGLAAPPRKVRRRRKSYCSILSESTALLHEKQQRAQTAAQELIAEFADKLMEKAFGPLAPVPAPVHVSHPPTVPSATEGPQLGPHALVNGKVVAVQLAQGKVSSSNDENIERQIVNSPAPSEEVSAKPLVIKQMVMISPTITAVREPQVPTNGSPLIVSPLNKKKNSATTTHHTPPNKEDVPHPDSRYKCQECHKGFFSAYNLRRHLKNVHKIDMGPPITATSTTTSTTTTTTTTPVVSVATTSPGPNQTQSHLMAALNGAAVTNPESDLDESSLDHFVVVNHSVVTPGTSVAAKNSLTALLEAPPVNATPPHV